MAMNLKHSLASLHKDLVKASHKKSELFLESIIEKYTCKSMKIAPPSISLDDICPEKDWIHSTQKFLVASLNQHDAAVDYKKLADLKRLGRAKNKQYNNIQKKIKESEVCRKLLGLGVPSDGDSDCDSLSVAHLLRLPKRYKSPKKNGKVITTNGVVKRCGLKLKSHGKSDSADAALSKKNKTTLEPQKKSSSHSNTTKLLGTYQTESQKEIKKVGKVNLKRPFRSASTCEVHLAKQLRNGKTYDKCTKMDVAKKKLKPTIKRRAQCLHSEANDHEDMHQNLHNLNLTALPISFSKVNQSLINNAIGDDPINLFRRESNFNLPKKCVNGKNSSGCKLQKRDSSHKASAELFNTCQTESHQEKGKPDQVNRKITLRSTSRCKIKLTKQLRNGKMYDTYIEQDLTKKKLKSTINKKKNQTLPGPANDSKDMHNNLENLSDSYNLPISLKKVTLNPIDKANWNDPISWLQKESHSHVPQKNLNDAFDCNINNNLNSSLTSDQSGQYGAKALPLPEQLLNHLDVRNKCVASSNAAGKSPVRSGSWYFVLHKDGSHSFMDDFEKIETCLKSYGFDKNETYISDLNDAFKRVTFPVDSMVKLTDISQLISSIPEESSSAELQGSKEKSFDIQETDIVLSDSQRFEEDLNKVGVVTRGSLSGIKHNDLATAVGSLVVSSCSKSISENESCFNILKKYLNLPRKMTSNSIKSHEQLCQGVVHDTSCTASKLRCPVVILPSDKNKSMSNSHSIINSSLDCNDDGNRRALMQDNTDPSDAPSLHLDAGGSLNNSSTETVPESLGNVKKIGDILKSNQRRSFHNQPGFESNGTSIRVASESCTISDKPVSSYRKPTNEFHKPSPNSNQNGNACDNPVASSHCSKQLNSSDISHSSFILCSDQNNDKMLQTTDISSQQAINVDESVNISDHTVHTSNLPDNLRVQLSCKTNQSIMKSKQLINESVPHTDRFNISTYNCDNSNYKSDKTSVKPVLRTPKPCQASDKSDQSTSKFYHCLHNADQQCDKHNSSTRKCDDISHQTGKPTNKSDRCNSKSHQLTHTSRQSCDRSDVSRNTSDQSTSNFDHPLYKSVQCNEISGSHNDKFHMLSHQARESSQRCQVNEKDAHYKPTFIEKLPVRLNSFRAKPTANKASSKSFQLVSESGECSDKSDQLTSAVNPDVSDCSLQPSTSAHRIPKLMELSNPASFSASSTLHNTLTSKKTHFTLLDSDDSSDSDEEEYSTALQKNRAGGKHTSNLPSLLSLCTMKESLEETISTGELLESLLF